MIRQESRTSNVRKGAIFTAILGSVLLLTGIIIICQTDYDSPLSNGAWLAIFFGGSCIVIAMMLCCSQKYYMKRTRETIQMSTGQVNQQQLYNVGQQSSSQQLHRSQQQSNLPQPNLPPYPHEPYNPAIAGYPPYHPQSSYAGMSHIDSQAYPYSGNYTETNFGNSRPFHTVGPTTSDPMSSGQVQGQGEGYINPVFPETQSSPSVFYMPTAPHLEKPPPYTP